MNSPCQRILEWFELDETLKFFSFHPPATFHCLLLELGFEIPAGIDEKLTFPKISSHPWCHQLCWASPVLGKLEIPFIVHKSSELSFSLCGEWKPSLGAGERGGQGGAVENVKMGIIL